MDFGTFMIVREFWRSDLQQYLIVTSRGIVYQSQDRMILFKDNVTKKIYLDEKYGLISRGIVGLCRNKILGEGIAATRKKICFGDYELTNLNGYERI